MVNSNFMLYYVYSDGLPFLLFLEFITKKMMLKHLPVLSKYLYETIDLPNSFWLTKIFLSLFLYQFKVDHCLRFWDLILSSDIFVSVSLIVSIMNHFQDQLMRMDLGDIMEWFQNMEHTPLNTSKLIHGAIDQYVLNKKDI